MSDYKIEKTLIASTPLIHFQWDQEGATLRATEVKPKLDRFLIRKVGKADMRKSWFVGETQALNYKMQIKADGEQNIVELNRDNGYDIFYANMGGGPQKKGVLGNITLTILCFEPELRQLIDDNLVEFFTVTNFGTMQDKGFGSYYVEGSNCSKEEIADMLKRNYGAKACYSFPAGDSKETFKRIKTVYGIMKSGINFNEYERSMLFRYMHEQYRMGNEKAWLKQQGIAPSLGKVTNQQDRVNYYVRALLGIGDHIDFLKSNENRKDKVQVSIKCKDGAIARLSSPIFFKVVKEDVFYVAGRIPDEIYGRTFVFSSERGSGELQVPPKAELGENFVDEFLQYCMGELNGGALKKFRDTQNISITEV